MSIAVFGGPWLRRPLTARAVPRRGRIREATLFTHWCRHSGRTRGQRPVVKRVDRRVCEVADQSIRQTGMEYREDMRSGARTGLRIVGDVGERG